MAITIMTREYMEALCCCGHMRLEHRELGESSCMTCGGVSCPKFHGVAEGHGLLARGLFLLFVFAVAIAITALGALAAWAIYDRMRF